jgi:hypothetical protein
MMPNQPSLFSMPQQGRTSDDYWTPKWIFDALGVQFDLDVACPPEGPAHTPAHHWYTQETDGLTSPWYGTVFMNPPFSKTAPWVHKWIEHGNGIALLPVVKETKWVRQLWDSEAKSVWFNDLTIKFYHKNKEQHIWTIVWLWAIGDECVEALHNSKLGRVR